jgi:hypothetical protein
LLLCGTPALLVASFTATAVTVVGQVEAQSATANSIVEVEGPLADLVTSPIALAPAFDHPITDYVLRCAAGTNAITFTLSAIPGGRIYARGTSGPSIVLEQSLIENQALIIDLRGPGNRGRTQYWIRCLPNDFPQLSVVKSGDPPPGWYLTGNLTSASVSGIYMMVLDNNGTPVWYQKPLANLGVFRRPMSLSCLTPK